MTEQTDKAFPVSWEELHRTSKALAWRLLELGPFDGLVAVTRGGLVPARHCRARTGNSADRYRLYGVVSWPEERGKVSILKEASLAGDGSGWLIVDDLVDTGETSKALRAIIAKSAFCNRLCQAGRPAIG